jgi:hypothetical protein
MKRWMFIVAWFVLQFLYNFLTKTSSAANGMLATRVVIAAGYFSAPIQIFAAILVVVAILKYPWKPKPKEPEVY